MATLLVARRAFAAPTLPRSLPLRRSFATPPNFPTRNGNYNRIPHSTRMLQNAMPTPASKTPPETLWEQHSDSVIERLAQPPTPFSGRSVAVSAGGFTSAYNNLKNILSRDNVQRELRMAERHEKKGYKRRRLASERWRRVLADQVRKKVKIVQAILRRGA